MIHKGRIVTEATVAELMKPLNLFEIVFQMKDGVPIPDSVQAFKLEQDGNHWKVRIEDVGAYSAAVSALAAAGATIHNTSSKSRSLEEYFIDLVSRS
jgi:ABC-type multidrug transport system ATPase subunit